MANKGLSMRKVREVLRLHYAAGLSTRAIARSLKVSPATVGKYIRRPEVQGLSWPLPEPLDDAALERRLFPAPVLSATQRPLPQWSEVHRELRQQDVTLALVWQEYKAAHPGGLQYSWFCDQYRAWASKLDVVIELDIEDFFGSVDWGHIRSFLDRRVQDGVIRRAIGKWLNAGVMEAGELSYPQRGTPQGGVVSPTLSNVYLHEVLDQWFEREVKPRLRGRAFEVRYADDAVLVFEHEDDARRVLAVLAKRLEKYGLRLHPDKTRMVEFCSPSKSQRGGSQRERSFAMLGFTHYWGRSRKGRWVVKRKTAKDRLSRALRGIGHWCRNHRHWKLREQQAALSRKLRGHYAYYGITGNAQALRRFRYEVERRWRKWLGRRSRSGRMSWERFARLLNTYPLSPVRVVHSVYR